MSPDTAIVACGVAVEAARYVVLLCAGAVLFGLTFLALSHKR